VLPLSFFEAKVLVEGWRREYKTLRPHGRTNLNTGTISGGQVNFFLSIHKNSIFSTQMEGIDLIAETYDRLYC
jgi:hypothetical protein